MQFWNDLNKENFKNAIAYLPFVAIFLYLAKDEKSLQLQKNIRYWIYFLIFYILFCWFIWIFYKGLKLPMMWVFFLCYIIICLIFSYVAYKWKEINIFIIDKIHDFISTIWD